ncbi:hypothetical protein Hypma_010117 [Hypsizygus marmoreus]|uniref:Uncharacterized protein n=1 Tax=Hypsizygus marmoreus TaxID=39966 RepID=A0A369JJT6_HYPMA|nr:hypothetical protein Hypma_010117 [Hypsizygus marmoreus]
MRPCKLSSVLYTSLQRPRVMFPITGFAAGGHWDAGPRLQLLTRHVGAIPTASSPVGLASGCDFRAHQLPTSVLRMVSRTRPFHASSFPYALKQDRLFSIYQKPIPSPFCLVERALRSGGKGVYEVWGQAIDDFVQPFQLQTATFSVATWCKAFPTHRHVGAISLPRRCYPRQHSIQSVSRSDLTTCSMVVPVCRLHLNERSEAINLLMQTSIMTKRTTCWRVEFAASSYSSTPALSHSSC